MRRMYGLALKHTVLLNMKAYKAYTHKQTFLHILQRGLNGGMEVLFFIRTYECVTVHV